MTRGGASDGFTASFSTTAVFASPEGGSAAFASRFFCSGTEPEAAADFSSPMVRGSLHDDNRRITKRNIGHHRGQNNTTADAHPSRGLKTTGPRRRFDEEASPPLDDLFTPPEGTRATPAEAVVAPDDRA